MRIAGRGGYDNCLAAADQTMREVLAEDEKLVLVRTFQGLLLSRYEYFNEEEWCVFRSKVITDSGGNVITFAARTGMAQGA